MGRQSLQENLSVTTQVRSHPGTDRESQSSVKSELAGSASPSESEASRRGDSRDPRCDRIRLPDDAGGRMGKLIGRYLLMAFFAFLVIKGVLYLVLSNF